MRLSNDSHDDSYREEDDNHSQTGILEKTKTKTKKPSLYKVILLNDDYTPMDFVILVLMKFFKKSEQEATQIMLNVHQKGSGLAGVFPFEVAETKVYQVNGLAKNQKYPLKCILEKE
ncbi:MAG: ATP-dependent Clp protease adapter ClpS [Bdellovibrionales bacterium]|nr:ATP-dependent Clp protease adapter ClpS [Bdellovibrionales bacterium]